MRDVFGVLEGHWPTHSFSFTYSSYRFQRSFFQTTWNHYLFPMQLGGKTVCVKFEVVDVPINYTLLLVRSWKYVMHAVIATVFQVLLFPHEGRIMTIDRLSFFRPDPSSGASTVLMIDNTQPKVINVGVGFFPPLMVTFDYSPPSGDIKMILVVPIVTHYFHHPYDH
jgi:hypothetical protein